MMRGSRDRGVMYSMLVKGKVSTATWEMERDGERFRDGERWREMGRDLEMGRDGERF